MRSAISSGLELSSVQVLRGIAAISVVLFHTNLILGQPQYGGNDVLGWASKQGWIGVNFFFVLSGFIIYTAHARDMGNPSSIPFYLWRRISRLYPIYWFLLCAFIGAAVLGIGHAEIDWSPSHLITAFSLLVVADTPVLPLKVAWTLLFEVKFYIVFITFLISRKLGWLVMAIWVAAILFQQTADAPYDWGRLTLSWGMLSTWNVNFLLGMLSAVSVKYVSRRYAIAIASVGFLSLIIVAYPIPSMEYAVSYAKVMLSIGASCSLLLIGIVSIEREYGMRSNAMGKLLGDASYSIYLVHSAVISFGAGVSNKLSLGLAPEIVFISLFLMAIMAGILIHLIIERPLLSQVRRLSNTSSGVQTRKAQNPPGVALGRQPHSLGDDHPSA